MSKKKVRFEAIPNFVAPLYAFIARTNPCIRDIHLEVAEEICAKMHSGKILDIGTGPGYLPLEIAMRALGVEITGIDVSPQMIRIANKNVLRLGLADRVKFQNANAESLPFNDNSFDFVCSTLSLHHWSDPAACFQEIQRVLKDNGEAYIYDLRRDTSAEDDRQIRARYGWFLSFLFLTIVRAHSSLMLKEAIDLLNSLETRFAHKSVQTNGVVLRLQVLK